jgi:hypothetical protein
MRVDVTPEDLIALSSHLAGAAADLDRHRAGIVEAVLAQATLLGGHAGPAAASVADGADDAVGRLVRAVRNVAALLSESAGVYVATDSDVPATHLRHVGAG